MQSKRLFVTAVACLELTALAIWLGGLSTLGAVVAPTIFGAVPTPTAADAMSLVFQRFDKIAMTAAVIALVCEALLAFRGGPVGLRGMFRGATVVLASALAIGEGIFLTPSIIALHRGGAIRGLGDAGLALERTHRLAESAGKAQVALILTAFVLLVVKVATSAHNLQTPLPHSEDIGKTPDVVT